MRPTVIVALVALGFMTCRRVEEPQSDASLHDVQATAAPEPPSTAPAASTAVPAPAAAVDAGRCVVPFAEPPAPPAKPAAACPHDPEASPPSLARGRVTFAQAPGAPAVEVEIADTMATVQRGLMYRTRLDANAGMIFVWPNETPRSFWMRNTCIPLDMMFIAKDGTIAGILEQVPVLNETSRSVPCPAAYVLEVNAGYARKHGIEPGMKATIEL